MKAPVEHGMEKGERLSGLVRVRGGFSDLNGIATCNNTVQMIEFDDPCRVRLSNKVYEILEILENGAQGMMGSPINGPHFIFVFFKNLLNDVLCVSNHVVDHRFDWRRNYTKYVETIILHATYNEVLDMTEYICRWIEERLLKRYKGYVYNNINRLFEQEYVGYRFVDGRIVAITDKNEIDAINEACSVPFEGCRKHFEKAVGFLADRETKDYKNSIKESISAVESVCQVILNNSKAVLSDALKQLEKNGTIIHPALNQAFIKMYAYTSDQGGIRHAEGLFESTVTFEEAKFMLVSCCAFTNYLIAEYGKKSG